MYFVTNYVVLRRNYIIPQDGVESVRSQTNFPEEAFESTLVEGRGSYDSSVEPPTPPPTHMVDADAERSQKNYQAVSSPRPWLVTTKPISSQKFK